MGDDLKKAAPATLGRFGHHDEPAMDFAIEVFEIEAEVAEPPSGTIDRKALEERIARAMSFRVGGTVLGMAAKQALRDAETAFRKHVEPFITNWHVIKVKGADLVTMTTTLDVGPLLFPSKAEARDYATRSKLPPESVEIVPAELRVGDSKS